MILNVWKAHFKLKSAKILFLSIYEDIWIISSLSDILPKGRFLRKKIIALDILPISKYKGGG